MRTTTLTTLALTALLGLGTAGTQAETGHHGPHKLTYEITITNLTRGTSFTPFLVASHRSAAGLIFTSGEPASDELAALAEGGATDPLQDLLESDPRVNDTSTSAGLLEPGHTVTVRIHGRPGRDHVSLAAMLLPTNDGFASLQNVSLPMGGRSRTYFAPGYDAGSEPNDELCISIPGPTCGGAGGSPGTGGENFVHIHAGIHGIGDLPPSDRDWRNPVAKITIQRAH